MSDAGLKSLVEEELEFEPVVNAAHIGVAVREGVVTLTGHVASYAEKVAAEKAAQRVRGVRAIAEEIEVRYPYDGKRSDDEIAKRAIKVLDWNTMVPAAVKVKVERGWITLSGTVDWQYQREAAESSVRKLDGVVGVSNTIALTDRPKADDVKKKIEDALKRNAALDAAAIHVTVTNDKVSLSGRVHSWQERRIAEQAAWSAAGVKSVDDTISIAA
ncbi:BON domain-containing protein [Hansschlegelia zhihuaiae]|uniref:BON domain-containing protein n=1 Tax=Hansschlegelia zhihuaiae TaxID=405005 RepID=A0A4Q0MJR1_9HYPH|nr:BON domain-containing protein [Hansschlegelia zhihuaiae]RXF73206.1 BON domain-containing protein [Hansschlegelia zhihuaiae]